VQKLHLTDLAVQSIKDNSKVNYSCSLNVLAPPPTSQNNW